jgi:hypothetical protein
MQLRVGGFEGEGFGVTLLRLGKLLLHPERIAESGVIFSFPRLQSYCAPERHDRCGDIAAQAQRVPKPVMRFGIVVDELYVPPELGDGLGVLSRLVEGCGMLPRGNCTPGVIDRVTAPGDQKRNDSSDHPGFE